MNFESFIEPASLILIPVLYIIGDIIKRIETINDKWIPLILGGFGIILAGLTVFGAQPDTATAQWPTALLTAIVQGILVAGAAVYGNQIYKQSKK